MAKKLDPRQQLTVAAEAQEPVWLKRDVDPLRIYGYVLGVGRKWVLLNYLEGAQFLNGYVAIRVKDVRQVKRLGMEPVTVEGLHHFGEVPQPVEGVNLSSTKGLITTVGTMASLVTIHVEKRDPDVCFIGQPVEVNKGILRLREIDPSADWKKKPTRWRLADITRVDFGGRYEAALALVGGSP